MQVEFGPGFEDSLNKLVWRQWIEPINPKAWYRKAKWFIQRGQRGYSDADLWNLNDKIAVEVPAFLDNPRYGSITGQVGARSESVEAEVRWLMEQHLLGWEAPFGDAVWEKRMAKARALFGKYWQGMWD